MTTLSDIVRDVLFELGFRERYASGGTTSTLVDADLGGEDTYDGGGAGAAPEGEFAEVTDYAESTGTITVATAAFTDAPAATDGYIVSTSEYPHRQVIRAVNRALSKIGDIPKVDTTTLDTASAQTEYDYAVTWKRQPPYRIDIQTQTNDADDNRWQELSKGFWYYVPAAAGSTGLIIFRDQLPTSRDLRIWYKGPHDAVEAYNDTIYEGLHPDLVVAEVVYELLRWRYTEQRGADEYIAQLLNEAGESREQMRMKHPVWKPKRRDELLIVGGRVEPDRFTYPGRS